MNLVLLKDRPLQPGHRLYAIAEASRRKDACCVVVCSCGERLAVGDARHYQDGLDLAARNHRRHIENAA